MRTGRGTTLGPHEWTQAALTAIADGGLAAVSVERLAKVLGATKGSFYWHFENREALIQAALSAWIEGETRAVAAMLEPIADAETRLRVLLRAALDDRPGARVEAGLLADSTTPVVQQALEEATRARTAYLRGLFKELGTPSPADRAVTGFAIYLGLLHMRRAQSSRTPRGRDLDRYVDAVCSWLAAGEEPPRRPGPRPVRRSS